MPGQPNIPPIIVFDVAQVHVVETAPGAFRPWTIIPPGVEFKMFADFSIDGSVGDVINGLAAPWLARYMAESIGPGDDYMWEVGPTGRNLDGSGAPGPHSYSTPATDITVSIPEPGTYKIAALVSICFGASPTFISGYAEGPIIEIRPTP